MLYESVSPTSKLPIIGGSGTPWNSGFQSQPPPHAHLRSKPDLGVRTEGLLTCWYKTGRSHFHQTPGDDGTERKCVWTTMASDELWAALLYLDSAVAPVSYDDVPIDVHSHTSGSIELAVSLPIGAKLQQQLSVGGENLTQKEKNISCWIYPEQNISFHAQPSSPIRGASPWQSGCGSRSQWSRCSCLPLQSADL